MGGALRFFISMLAVIPDIFPNDNDGATFTEHKFPKESVVTVSSRLCLRYNTDFKCSPRPRSRLLLEDLSALFFILVLKNPRSPLFSFTGVSQPVDIFVSVKCTSHNDYSNPAQMTFL
uniref:Uncharacterized protein n=1 Tax=Micrurus corallinus TaxID=54390 RepID=A0A2D4G109_MICCO